MEFKLNITAGQVIATIAIALLCFGAGYLTNTPKTISEVSCSDYNGFSDKDLNYLGQASYLAGHCERIGLISSIFIQDFNGQKYGVPICIEGVKNE
jgi:hypothetical protein